MTNNGIILMQFANELEKKRFELSKKRLTTSDEEIAYNKIVSQIDKIDSAIKSGDDDKIVEVYNEIFHLSPKPTSVEEDKPKVLYQMSSGKYYATPFDRALALIKSYKYQDEKYYKRGKCTLTPEWIIDNIFTHKCHYCGEDDWEKLGCDRIDNSLPHTPENVVPCCAKCNIKRGTMNYQKFFNQTMQTKMGVS